ncbi:MAG: hypothetical protein U1F77_01705 [Kiritimatiellia bacterium]
MHPHNPLVSQGRLDGHHKRPFAEQAMILKRTYTNSEWWYCVFQGGTGTTVLVATVPGVGCYDIAMVLNDDETILVEAKDKSDLTTLARDLVASRSMPIFKSRVFYPNQIDVDRIELPDEQ